MEERRRSVVKGISWRCLATLDTILLALIFTGSVRAALSIGSIELLTKTLWYYAHERAWLLAPEAGVSAFARLFGNDSRTRSIAKAMSWRAVGAFDTFAVALVITGRATLSGAIGGTELFTKVPLYYLHERLWAHVRWGKDAPAPLARFAHLPEEARETLELLRGYYHLSAAVFYGLLCCVSIFIGALLVYAVHLSS